MLILRCNLSKVFLLLSCIHLSAFSRVPENGYKENIMPEREHRKMFAETSKDSLEEHSMQYEKEGIHQEVLTTSISIEVNKKRIIKALDLHSFSDILRKLWNKEVRDSLLNVESEELLPQSRQNLIKKHYLRGLKRRGLEKWLLKSLVQDEINQKMYAKKKLNDHFAGWKRQGQDKPVYLSKEITTMLTEVSGENILNSSRIIFAFRTTDEEYGDYVFESSTLPFSECRNSAISSTEMFLKTNTLEPSETSDNQTLSSTVEFTESAYEEDTTDIDKIKTQLLKELLEEKIKQDPEKFLSKNLSILSELLLKTPKNRKVKIRQKYHRNNKGLNKKHLVKNTATLSAKPPEANTSKSIRNEENISHEGTRETRQKAKPNLHNKIVKQVTYKVRDYERIEPFVMKSQEVFLFISLNSAIFIVISIITVFVVLRLHRYKPIRSSVTQTERSCHCGEENKSIASESVVPPPPPPPCEPYSKSKNNDGDLKYLDRYTRVLKLTPKADSMSELNLQNSWSGSQHQQNVSALPPPPPKLPASVSRHRERARASIKQLSPDSQALADCPSLSAVINSALSRGETKSRWLRASRTKSTQN